MTTLETVEFTYTQTGPAPTATGRVSLTEQRIALSATRLNGRWSYEFATQGWAFLDPQDVKNLINCLNEAIERNAGVSSSEV